MTMELSMTIALVSVLAIGQFFTALVITAFVLGTEMLEGLAVGRGRKAIPNTLELLPRTASILRDGQILNITNRQQGGSSYRSPAADCAIRSATTSGCDT